MAYRIFKFGGASVKDASGIRNVVRIIRAYGLKNPLVVVVSAMGKTTNALEELLALAQKKSDYSILFHALISSHSKTVNELFSNEETQQHILKELQRHFERLDHFLAQANQADPDFLYDQVVPIGEYLSSYLLFAFLKAEGISVNLIDAATIIRTNKSWREGEVMLKDSSIASKSNIQALQANEVVLTQGFLGGTEDGYRTTLGREGSDYTAALLAYFLDAESVSIWKDVPGVLSADPAWKKDAVLLSELSYQDAAELTYYGATVIHPKTIRPLAWKKIPLHVKSFINPDQPGTLVGAEGKKLKQESWIRKKNQVLISLSSRDFSFMEADKISELLQEFSDAGLKMQMLQVSATSISLVTDEQERRLEKVLSKISGTYSILFNHHLTLITVLNPGAIASDFRINGSPPFLLQKTRSSLQMLFQEADIQ